MNFQHTWQHQEANFSAPISEEVRGGAHVSFEVLLRYQDSYVLVRRPQGVRGHVLPDAARASPSGLLYLCYDLIRWGESTQQCISRIVQDQTGCSVHAYKAAQFYSFVHQEQNNWALTPCFVAELTQLPKLSAQISEVLLFTRDSIPTDIAWWTPEQLRELMG